MNWVLNSWKEIANYLNRGIRTVQRWEQTLGLPVRRPRGKRRSAVIALRSDIDAWLRSRPLNAEAGFRGKPPTSRVDPVGVRFLLTEADLGLTFASLALMARSGDKQRIRRNTRNAQTAYETILRFRERVDLDDAAAAQLDGKLEQLKHVLQGELYELRSRYKI